MALDPQDGTRTYGPAKGTHPPQRIGSGPTGRGAIGGQWGHAFFEGIACSRTIFTPEILSETTSQVAGVYKGVLRFYNYQIQSIQGGGGGGGVRRGSISKGKVTNEGQVRGTGDELFSQQIFPAQLDLVFGCGP